MSEQKVAPKCVLLTTIGTGDYKPVSYQIDGEKTEVHPFFPYLLAKRLLSSDPNFKIDEIVVLLTEEAHRTHWKQDGDPKKVLKAALETLLPSAQIKPLNIKDGFTEKEIWEIFTEIYQKIDEGTHLYLDVTHGFRHLPMIILAACMYLRRTKQVIIQVIYYGVLPTQIRKHSNYWEIKRPELDKQGQGRIT
jgi:CRISPR-associated Csx2 family protein